MAQIRRSVTINARPETIFQILTDLERLPDWVTGSARIHEISQQPIEVGTTFTQTFRVAGRELPLDGRVTELDAPRRLAIDLATPGGGDSTMSYDLTPDGAACHIEFASDYHLPGGIFGDLIDRAFAERRTDREMGISLQNLKELAEATEHATVR
jgi:uncharacterized protein YndB with AHSA1/START domain